MNSKVRSVGVLDVNQSDLVTAAAAFLKRSVINPFHPHRFSCPSVQRNHLFRSSNSLVTHPLTSISLLRVHRSGKLKVGEWVDIVKTGTHKELAPANPDWYFVRCAAVARHVAVRSPVGVGALTKVFGGKKRRGTAPSKYVRGSSSIARRALQALEQIKWIEKDPNGSGRRLTSQGRRDLDRIASSVKDKRKKTHALEVY